MRLLLDTHVLIWFAGGRGLTEATVDELRSAARDAALMVSVTTAWEIGILVRKGRVDLDAEPKIWFDRAMLGRGIRTLPITSDIAIESAFLPEPFHSDPADRLLVASARHHDLTLVTRDRRILAYAEAGHLRALAC